MQTRKLGRLWQTHDMPKSTLVWQPVKPRFGFLPIISNCGESPTKAPPAACDPSNTPHLPSEATEQENAMKCPVDNETLVMADRGGVEIDYCPKCRGVWLDRGELDKIIERSLTAAPAAAAPVPPRPAPPQPAPQGYAPDPRYRDDDDHRYGYKRKKRESFLGELFDF